MANHLRRRWLPAVGLMAAALLTTSGNGRTKNPGQEGIRRLTTATGTPWLIRTSTPKGSPSPGGLGGALGWGESASVREGGSDLCGLAIRSDAGCVEPISVYRPEGAGPEFRGSRNRLVFPSMRAGDIEVSREVDVLEGSDLCRWFDSFTNLAAEPRTFEVALYHGWGSGDRPLAAVSNADGSVGPGSDDGFVLVRTGQWASGKGASGVLGHVVQGADSRAPLLRADFGAGGPIYEPGLGPVAAIWVYRMTLAPGRRGILLNALAADPNADIVRAELRRHLDARLLILNGLTREERQSVMNFNSALATTAWPQVEILTPHYGLVASTFPVHIHAADVDKIVRMELTACAEGGGGYDDVVCRPPSVFLDQGPSLDYNLTMNHCDFEAERGELYLSAVVRNSAGQTAMGQVEFSISNPGGLSPILVSPSNGAGVSGRVNVHVDANAPNPAVLTILVDGVERHRETRGYFADPPGVYWEWDTTRDTDGPHRLEAVLSDYQGNSERTCRITVSVFNGIPPTVTIERPADGAVVHGTVGISVRAADDVRVVSLGLFLDGASMAEVQGSSSSLSAEALWETMEAANGTHEIKAVARDNDGLEASRVIHVEVKNIVLTLDVSLGVDRAWLIKKNYGIVKLSIENPAGLDVSRYVLYRSADGAAYQSIQEVPAANISGNAHTFNDLTIQKGHAYSYRVEAFDAAGAKIGRSAEVTL